MRLRSVGLELARQDAPDPADRGVLRNNGDLALVGFRLALGLGWLRLDQQSRDYGTHGGGRGEGVEGDLEAVHERRWAEGGGPGVGVHVVVGERDRDRGGGRDADRAADLLACVEQA